jgi:hypothetical protein
MYATLTARKVSVTEVTLLLNEMKHTEVQADKQIKPQNCVFSVVNFLQQRMEIRKLFLDA